jgi:hypothetical protein
MRETFPPIPYPFPHKGGKGLMSGGVLAAPARPAFQAVGDRIKH